MNPDAQIIVEQQTIELAARDAAAGILPPGQENETPAE
jgi:hypothetical protein